MKRLCMIFTCLAVAACGGTGEKTGEEISKLQFSAETNPVKVILLEPSTFYKELVGNGKVYAENKSSIGFKVSGTVESINVQNGDHVQAGEIIATLDRTDALNNYQNALENFEKSKIDLNDAIIGFGYQANDTLSVSDEIMSIARVRSGYNLSKLTLEKAGQALDNCDIKAPFSGKIANLNKKTFERAGDEFCTLIDDSRMVAEFYVFESELAVIRKGQEVRISSFFDKDMEAMGRITSINPTVDDKGQVRVSATFTNPRGFIDGMNIKAFAQSAINDQLVVPKSAVVIRDNLEVLFRYSNGKAIWTYVHILNENSHSYIVAPNVSRGADLSPGDSIIVAGNLNLAHDSSVQLEN